jgi:DNA invertase Pin-like site-specific DNA recombinase
MRAVAYLRVSTAAQGRSGLGLEAQRSAVSALALARRLTIAGEFVEVESGKLNGRAELAKALQQAKLTGAVLVIAKLDRLSRNAAFLLTLRDSGVRFLAADMPDANDLTIGIMAVIAQAEREAISRRTAEALTAIKQRLQANGEHQSKRSGRRIARLGNPNGSAALRRTSGNAAASAAVARLANARAQGLAPLITSLQADGITSLGGIAKALNDRGVLTPRRGRWHCRTVALLLGRLRHLSDAVGT